jgi:hypothetical protein
MLVSCGNNSDITIKNNNGRLSIVSTDMVASIHTKMIVGEHATISPVNQ